jgi:hypothetical protein
VWFEEELLVTVFDIEDGSNRCQKPRYAERGREHVRRF